MSMTVKGFVAYICDANPTEGDPEWVPLGFVTDYQVTLRPPPRIEPELLVDAQLRAWTDRA